VAPFHLSDLASEHELDDAVADFFVEAHGGAEFGFLGGGETDGGGQAGALEKSGDSLNIGFREAGEFVGELCGHDLADGDGFAVEVASVGMDGLDAVSDGVAEVEDFAEASFGFVLADDIGLDGAGAGDDGFEGSGAAFEDAGEVLFDSAEEGCVVNDAVFDDFGEAGDEFAVGKSFESVEIAEDEARLVEGADEVFSCGEVDSCFSADGAIDLGEEGGGDLDEGDAAEVGGSEEACEVTDDAAAEGDEGGFAFEPVLGEEVVAEFDLAEAFGAFAGGDGDGDGFDSVAAEGLLDLGCPEGFDLGIGDDGAFPAEGEGLVMITQTMDEPFADVDAIGPFAEMDRHRFHGVNVESSTWDFTGKSWRASKSGCGFPLV
jgi:hypothetical protein